MLLLHSAPWAWTVTLKSEPQGRFLNVQLVFVVWQLSRCPSPTTWARKLELPVVLDQLITAVLVPQSYCLDVTAGEQGAGKQHGERGGHFEFADYRIKGKANAKNYYKHTCDDGGAGSGGTVTLVPSRSDRGRVCLTTQEVRQATGSCVWAAGNTVPVPSCCINCKTCRTSHWCPAQKNRTVSTCQPAALDGRRTWS